MKMQGRDVLVTHESAKEGTDARVTTTSVSTKGWHQERSQSTHDTIDLFHATCKIEL